MPVIWSKIIFGELTGPDQLFKNGEFPEVKDLKYDPVIRGYWTREIRTATEVAKRLCDLATTDEEAL
jgi:hypothetical protein